MMTFLQKRSSSAHRTETRRWVTNGQWQRVSKVLTGNSKASFSVSRRSAWSEVLQGRHSLQI